MTFFDSFHLANSSAAILLVFVPLLILAYLRQKRLPRIVVSSTLILKELTKHVVAKRKFKPPLRFFLELLAMLLLAIAAAGPFMSSSGKNIAIVIDTSMSMSARRGASNNSLQRIDEALSLANNFLSKQNNSSRFTCYSSSPTFTQVGPADLTSDAAKKEIANILAANSPDSLELGVAELASSAKFDSIVVFTDKVISNSSSGKSAKDRPLAEIELFSVGIASSNAFISNAKLELPTQVSNKKVRASIGLSNNSPLEVTARLFAQKDLKAKDKNAFTLITEKKVLLNPQHETEVQFELDKLTSESSLFRLDIESDANYNSIAIDDTAWISNNSTLRTAVLLVSPSEKSGDGLGLKKIDGLEITSVLPEDFAKLRKSALSDFSLIVFHQSAPTKTPSISTLLVLPPEQNSIFPLKAEVSEPKITSWDESSPLTAYLQVPLLAPQNAVTFELRPWMSSVLNVESGPIIVSGESRGHRFAALGFEIFPFEGARTLAHSVLTLNLMRWLTNKTDLGIGMLTGSSIELLKNRSWIIATPKEEILHFETDADKTIPFYFGLPGQYKITNISGSNVDSIKQRTEVITANAFHANESKTFEIANIQLPAQLENASIPSELQEPLWPYLALLVIIVLLVEFAIRMFPNFVNISTRLGTGD